MYKWKTKDTRMGNRVANVGLQLLIKLYIKFKDEKLLFIYFIYLFFTITIKTELLSLHSTLLYKKCVKNCKKECKNVLNWMRINHINTQLLNK